MFALAQGPSCFAVIRARCGHVSPCGVHKFSGNIVSYAFALDELAQTPKSCIKVGVHSAAYLTAKSGAAPCTAVRSIYHPSRQQLRCLSKAQDSALQAQTSQHGLCPVAHHAAAVAMSIAGLALCCRYTSPTHAPREAIGTIVICDISTAR